MTLHFEKDGKLKSHLGVQMVCSSENLTYTLAQGGETMRFRISIGGALLVFALAGTVTAQGLFIYPNQGQSPEQLNRDKYECHGWAVQQTGVDPMNPRAPTAPSYAPPPMEAPQGGIVRGGARGALLGVVGGAIAGNAGKGAAIGAATGALFGGMRRRDQRRRQQTAQQQYQQQQMQAQQQQQQAAAQQRHGYNRAMSACLSARGYTVN